MKKDNESPGGRGTEIGILRRTDREGGVSHKGNGRLRVKKGRSSLKREGRDLGGDRNGKEGRKDRNSSKTLRSELEKKTIA